MLKQRYANLRNPSIHTGASSTNNKLINKTWYNEKILRVRIIADRKTLQVIVFAFRGPLCACWDTSFPLLGE